MQRKQPPEDKFDTLMMLAMMSRYDYLPLLPLDAVLADFFGGMSAKVFLRKVTEGEINLPVVSMGSGQKATRAVHVRDLIAYITARRAEARHYML